MVCIADIISHSEVNMKTMKYITFKGKNGVVIDKGKEIYSDTIFYPLKAISDIAISIYFGSVPRTISGHVYSLPYSYIEIGNKINKIKFTHKKKHLIGILFHEWKYLQNLQKKLLFVLVTLLLMELYLKKSLDIIIQISYLKSF